VDEVSERSRQIEKLTMHELIANNTKKEYKKKTEKVKAIEKKVQ
jgi:hypothetical protein